MEDRIYKLYMHTCNINNKKYIGITKQTLDRRFRKNGRGYKNSIKFYSAIQKYGWENFEHQLILQNLTKQEAEFFEIEMIKYYKSSDRKYGYNVANGGNTVGTVSEETKKKLSKINIGKHVGSENYFYGKKYTGEQNYFYGKKLSEEHRRKISETRKQKGIKPWNYGVSNCFSKETREKMSKSQKNPRPHLRGENSATSKPIICINTGKIFCSITEASKNLNLFVSRISAVCNGKNKHTKGYVFMFLSEYKKGKISDK